MLRWVERSAAEKESLGEFIIQEEIKLNRHHLRVWHEPGEKTPDVI